MKCKYEGVGLTVGSTKKRKDGSRYVQYICRVCNAKKKRMEQKRNPSYLYRATARYRAKFPEKQKARILARNNVPIQPCQVCGDKAVRHHEDYSKPLEVVFLCYLHHKQVHRGEIQCPKLLSI